MSAEEELWASSEEDEDEEKENGTTMRKRGRDKEGEEDGHNDGTGEDDNEEEGEEPSGKRSSRDEDSDDPEEEDSSSPAMKKKKSQESGDGETTKKTTTKKKKRKLDKKFVEEEAEESGSDGDDDSDEEVDYDEYEDDGMIVMGDEEEDDDEENKKKREKRKAVERKRLKRSKHMSMVDEDDLELLEDNLRAQRGTDGKEIKPERVRAASDNPFDDDDSEGGDDNKDVDGRVSDQATATARHNRYVDDYDSDEMKGFIEDDEDDDMAEEEGREDRRRRRKEQGRAQMLAGGPSREQLEEAEALFGEGFEEMLGEASDGEEEEEDGDVEGSSTDVATKESRRLQKLRARFERSTLVESFCTSHDDVLRVTDRPERLIDVMEGRVAPDADERVKEAEWISGKLADQLQMKFRDEAESHGGNQAAGYNLGSSPRRPELWSMEKEEIEKSIKSSVEKVLEFIQVDDYEVPFIWSYRKDYINTDMLTRDHLWYIQEQDERWEELVEKKRRLSLDWKLISEAANGSESADTGATEKSIAMKVSSKEIQLEELSSVLEKSQIELEESEENLEVVKTSNHSGKGGWDDDEEEEEEENAGESKDDSEISQQEKIALAEARVVRAKAEVDACRALANGVEAELQELKTAQKSVFSAYSCSRSVAESFLSLFPIDNYQTVLDRCSDETEANDLQVFYGLILKGCQAEQGSSADDNNAKKKLKKGLLDRDQAYLKARKSRKLREFIQLFNVNAYELGEAMRLGKSMLRKPPNPTPSVVDIHEVASEYLSSEFPTSSSVIEGARCILATEIAFEPSIRQAAREMFMKIGTLSSYPTPLGCEVINPFHELFGVHLIRNKPLKELFGASGSDRHLFARLMKAQKEGLVTVSINAQTVETNGGPMINLDAFLQGMKLMEYFFPKDPHPWDSERTMILCEVLERHLLPALHVEAKRELMRLSRDAIIQECAASFQRMVSVGPYRPSGVHSFDVLKSCPARPFYCTVASIYLPTEPRDSIFFAYVDKDGLVRAHDLLPGKINKQKKEKIRDFLKACLPDVVAINTSAGQASKSTRDMIENYTIKEIQDLVQAERNSRRNRRGYNYMDDYSDDEENLSFNPDVILVRDDVARIFGSSTRAKKMFPEILPGGASAICLARYVQDPLNEFANMWTSADSIGFFGFESFYLDIHPLQSMVERAKVPLLRALERCLVNVVCDTGVDLNLAISHDHLAGTLAFVAGLGLRKADALRSNVKSVLGYVSSRRELFERKLLGRTVYTNAAGYLRICDNGMGDVQLDPFDDTRIHPECYVQNDFAQKICASAIEHDHNAEVYVKTVLLLREHCRRELEKNLEGNGPFKEAWASRGELLELPDKMERLELEAYAEEVESSGRGKRYRQLCDIKQELRYPYLDRRFPLPACPDDYDMFSLLTGETDQSLYVGMRVPCTILTTRSRSAEVVTGSGIRGFVRRENCSDDRVEEVEEVLQRGSTVAGVILEVNKAQLRVEVSLKESDVSRGEAYWFSSRDSHPAVMKWWQECRTSPRVRLPGSRASYMTLDKHFAKDEALEKYTAAEEAKSELVEQLRSQEPSGEKSGRGHRHRAVFHPLFHNVSSKGAENLLLTESGSPIGNVVIRPSASKDSLIVTWMYLPGRFKHIEVEERNKKEHQGGIGEELCIKGESEPFSDLDEIFARYIQPMNDLVSQLITYRCYKEFRPEGEEAPEPHTEAVEAMTLEQWLNQEKAANPSRIPYCISLNDKGASGYFQLSWLRNAGHKVYKEYIAIKPDGYRVQKQFFSSPSELIRWFKGVAQEEKKPQPTRQRKSRFSNANPHESQPPLPPQRNIPPPPPRPPSPQQYAPPPPPRHNLY